MDYAVAVLGVEGGWSREELEALPWRDVQLMLAYAHERLPL